MALAALSGDEQCIIFVRLCNVLDPGVAVAFGSASSELWELTQAPRQQLQADYEAAAALGLNSELINSLVPCSARETQPWKPLDPLKQWLDDLDPRDERISSFIVQLIPSQCPFERDIILFGRKLVHVPAMCKINPLYEQLIALRFRCLGHLSMDEQLRISCRESAQV